MRSFIFVFLCLCVFIFTSSLSADNKKPSIGSANVSTDGSEGITFPPMHGKIKVENKKLKKGNKDKGFFLVLDKPFPVVDEKDRGKLIAIEKPMLDGVLLAYECSKDGFLIFAYLRGKHGTIFELTLRKVNSGTSGAITLMRVWAKDSFSILMDKVDKKIYKSEIALPAKSYYNFKVFSEKEKKKLKTLGNFCLSEVIKDNKLPKVLEFNNNF